MPNGRGFAGIAGRPPAYWGRPVAGSTGAGHPRPVGHQLGKLAHEGATHGFVETGGDAVALLLVKLGIQPQQIFGWRDARELPGHVKGPRPGSAGSCATQPS